jgi:hypothetical protein
LEVRIGNKAMIEAVAKEILSNCLELIFMIN